MEKALTDVGAGEVIKTEVIESIIELDKLQAFCHSCHKIKLKWNGFHYSKHSYDNHFFQIL